ncbi:hypothetical protein R3W88_019156 [Solanum pinnatisectum]|uniref:Retrotransposon gag domain-containing protein n=1 Tax=Solanum pinnatisectum TaxID=50273 RepID=A0AAV9KJ03_9SOLN|nr:hypothetical protein R3W88_019156 [Solanum pinnatisectum]
MTNMFSLRKNHPFSHPTIWTISPHPIPTHTLSQQISSTRLNFEALQYERTRDKTEKSKLDALQQNMHNLEEKVNGRLNSKPAHDLRYQKLCLHPRVELPKGFKIQKFNMFDGYGYPIAHLKDFCSRLVGLENNEPLLMRLFIQSLSRIAFTWYVKQDFNKWFARKDMARDFVEQYRFNMKDDPTLLNLLEIRKLSHESFEEYIRHSPHEEDWVQTLIRSLDGIYYKTLFFAGIQSFDISQFKVGKPCTFTPLIETLTSIFQKLWAKGLLRPREGWIPKHYSSTLDLSKNCAYHSNIQGHDTEECPALRNKIPNMIEKRKNYSATRITKQQLQSFYNKCNHGSRRSYKDIFKTLDKEAQIASKNLRRTRLL